jgi:hypothetical protein
MVHVTNLMQHVGVNIPPPHRRQLRCHDAGVELQSWGFPKRNGSGTLRHFRDRMRDYVHGGAVQVESSVYTVSTQCLRVAHSLEAPGFNP